ncbi:PHP domain-containing protein [uncultured Ilyobacter sp.]|uniref:PHP domain-containing protein n=1 Tax=uncultured Ilyobacter sp. TaxID=544433 RepID=UPI0029C99E34|nr:PHP domain-containing protein [uncultured Ilyobacter sp.]
MIEFDKISDYFNEFYDFGPKDDIIYLDLHLHTNASDGYNTPKFFIDFLKEKKHLISITDHNEIRGSVKISELGVKVVPGMELGCEDGFELLVYFKNFEDLEEFYVREVEGNKHPYRMARTTKDAFYFLDILEGRGCHVSIPHVNGLAQKNYIKNKHYLSDVLTRVDSLETYNHSLSKKRNLTAKDLRKSYHLSATFGSDAHINREILSYYRFLNMEEKKHHKLMDSIYKISMLSGLGKKHLMHLFKKK